MLRVREERMMKRDVGAEEKPEIATMAFSMIRHFVLVRGMGANGM